MTARQAFRVRLLRPATFGARRVLPGTVVEVDPATASELVRAGQAVLVDEADIGVLVDAIGDRRWSTPVTR